MKDDKPPLYTLLSEHLSWTFDRTAGFPKSHRFTVGQRLDNLMLDSLERCLEALYTTAENKRQPLQSLNLNLEKLRVFWRIAHQQRWISQQQLFFAVSKIDEIGRMTGAWIKSLPTEKRRHP